MKSELIQAVLRILGGVLSGKSFSFLGSVARSWKIYRLKKQRERLLKKLRKAIAEDDYEKINFIIADISDISRDLVGMQKPEDYIEPGKDCGPCDNCEKPAPGG